jgi:demethylmenaquinone methyltransferase/2-methoxy-6-polyprenyl-1,4-benzoquinol methylase
MASEKAKVAKRYDSWSRYYDSVDTFPLLGRTEKRWRLEAVGLLDIQPSDRILDVGTGTGLILPWLAEEVTTGKVIGTDISEKMLATARERVKALGLEGKVELKKDDIEAMAFDDESFDRVIATFTLTTVPDFRVTIAEMHRVLKPSGKAVILDTGKPRGAAKVFYYPMMATAKLFGRTHFDKDVQGELRKQTSWKIIDEKWHYAGMVYCFVTRKSA